MLPFVVLSPARDNEYFSDGVSEELLNRLAKMDRLRVTGRTSSFAFKCKNEDLRTIGEKLGVDHILEGSVRKQGEWIRINVQLVDALDGSRLCRKHMTVALATCSRFRKTSHGTSPLQ